MKILMSTCVILPAVCCRVDNTNMGSPILFTLRSRFVKRACSVVYTKSLSSHPVLLISLQIASGEDYESNRVPGGLFL